MSEYSAATNGPPSRSDQGHKKPAPVLDQSNLREAVQKLLARTGVGIDQIDAVEINEAFASQSIACLRDLGIPFEKANLWGGALAIGHSLGHSGVRITVTLNSIMKANPSYKLGLSTLCVGFGQGNATLWERVS